MMSLSATNKEISEALVKVTGDFIAYNILIDLVKSNSRQLMNA